jgi:Protein of unknown function (Hypoth_ymh)
MRSWRDAGSPAGTRPGFSHRSAFVMAELFGSDLADFVALEADEVAMLLLPRLRHAEASGQQLNGWNVVLAVRNEVRHAGASEDEARLAAQTVGEAWQWLCSEGFLAPHPDHSGDWMMLTRAGHRVDPASFIRESRTLGILRHADLDADLRAQVYPLMRRGQFDLAMMASMRLVEDRVRTVARVPRSVTGSVSVMQHAFGTAGALRDPWLNAGAADPRMSLFSGAMSVFRNPPSHAPIPTDPEEAAEAVLLANLLLRELARARRVRRRTRPRASRSRPAPSRP